MIRVVIADDQAVVRGGLRMILESEEGIEVAGEAADGRQALDLLRELDPDVVLMDIACRPWTGSRPRAGSMRPPRARVCWCSPPTTWTRTLRRAEGRSGRVHREDGVAGAFGAGRPRRRRRRGLARSRHTRRLVDRFVTGPRPNTPAPPELEELTDRELEVLKLVAGGLSNAEIAKALFISDGTVKTHVARILSKLGLRDRVQVVAFAYERGIAESSVP